MFQYTGTETGGTMPDFSPFRLPYPPQAVFLAKGAKKAEAAKYAKARQATRTLSQVSRTQEGWPARPPPL